MDSKDLLENILSHSNPRNDRGLDWQHISLVEVLFNRYSVFLWISTVLFSLTCSVIRVRKSSYIVFSWNTKVTSHILKLHVLQYRWCTSTKYFYVFLLCGAYLFQWAWKRNTPDTARSASNLHLDVHSDDQIDKKAILRKK